MPLLPAASLPWGFPLPIFIRAQAITSHFRPHHMAPWCFSGVAHIFVEVGTLVCPPCAFVFGNFDLFAAFYTYFFPVARKIDFGKWCWRCWCFCSAPVCQPILLGFVFWQVNMRLSKYFSLLRVWLFVLFRVLILFRCFLFFLAEKYLLLIPATCNPLL